MTLGVISELSSLLNYFLSLLQPTIEIKYWLNRSLAFPAWLLAEVTVTSFRPFLAEDSAHSLWDKTANFSHLRNTMPMRGLITLRATNLLKENRGKREKGNTFPTGLIYSLGSLHACFVAIAAWGWYRMLPTILPTRKKNLGTSLRVMWKICHTIPNCAQVCTELFTGHLNCREVTI